MPSETNLQTTGTLAPDIVGIWLRDELLERAERQTVFWDLADKTQLPRGNGQVVQFTRYEYLVLPEAPLEESVTPQATPLTISTVQAVVDQWGAQCAISDRAEMTVRHPVMQITRDLLGDQHDQTIDREMQVVIMGTTGVGFAGNVASRSALTAANVLRTDDIRRQVATLRSQGARTYELGAFKGVFDPFVEGDLTKDPTFVNAGVYSDLITLKDFEVGKWMGVRWMRSNFIPIISLMPSSYYTITALTAGSIPAGGTGFALNSHVKIKITQLDPNTKFETVISAEQDLTNAAAFAASIQLNGAGNVAPTATYKIYCTLEGGASGTETFQLRFRLNTGANQTVNLVKAGTGLPANAFVVTGTGAIAPPDPPASINVHLTYIMGRGFIGATELGGLEAFFVPRRPSDTDPLAQRARASWKQIFKAVVLNPDFGRRLESASDFS